MFREVMIALITLALCGRSIIDYHQQQMLNDHEKRLFKIEHPPEPVCGWDLSIGEYSECMGGGK